MFELFQAHLPKCGVEAERVIFINFEDVDNEPLRDYKALYEPAAGEVKNQRRNPIWAFRRKR